MFRIALVRSLIVGAGVALLSTGCTPENLSGPQQPLSTPSATVTPPAAPAASANLLGGILQVPGTLVQAVTKTIDNLLFPVVQRKVALDAPITVSRVIGYSGGSIAIPEAGMTITFSRGALRSNTMISVTADAGHAISYEFGPHGTQFNAPVTIQQDMSMTTLADRPEAANGIRGGYTANGLSDIVNGLFARVAEVLTATTSIVTGVDGRQHLGTTSFVVKHFSGYILISI
ncbi:MAG: hypothetical protein ABI026_00055 [Gemmatimonadaceae bacterium]